MSRYTWALIGQGIYYFLNLIDFALFLRIILSWFVDPFNRIMQVLVTLTEPFVAPVRNLMARLSRSPMMVDFSPVMTSFVILFLQRVVVSIFM